jgi:phosphohistidine swiveling domain-containing protein
MTIEAAVPDASGLLGSGNPVSFPPVAEVRGTVAVLAELGDALELLGGPPEALSSTILWISEPVVTIVAPVMEHVAAILCATGGPASHVAIVARELGLACVMSCALTDEQGLAGRVLAIHPDGTIWSEARTPS